MRNFKLFLLIIFLGCLVGCASNEEKAAIDTGRISEVLTNNGFAVVDDSEFYKKESYVLKAVSGTYGDVQISMIEYTDAEMAEKVLKSHIDTFNLRKSTGASTVNQEGKNFHKYILISNNYYMRSVRVEDTLVFCNTQLPNKDVVEKIYDEIGY